LSDKLTWLTDRQKYFTGDEKWVRKNLLDSQ
jgi:hypothetical protein